MKLYATVTSERASKGQGGNDFLNIKLIVDNGNRHEIGIVRLAPHLDGWMLVIDRSSVGRERGSARVYEEVITLKGEKQKGEKQKGEHEGDHYDCEPCKEWLREHIPF